MTREEQIADLRRKLAARQGRPGFGANVKALESRIAAMEASE